MAEPGWRLFLAVPLPAAITTQVTEITSALAVAGWPVRWIGAEAAHITLHFLGDTSPERAELLRLALPRAIAAIPSFAMRTTRLGVFPNFRRPRVIWLGLDDPAQRLEQVQRTLAGMLRSLDFPVDEQRFTPHITLGRLRDAREMDTSRLATDIQHRLEQVSTKLASLPLPVQEVILYRSVLSRGGARYQALLQVPLENRRSPSED